MDPPLGNGYHTEEESLGPWTYQRTLSLLSDDKKTAPTRFELFHARKEFENVLRANRSLIAKQHRLRQIIQMRKALRETFDLIYSEIIEGLMKSIHLLDSKVLTRSMTGNIKRFLSEVRAIWAVFIEKSHIVEEVNESVDLGQFLVTFVRDVNKLKDRIMATKQLRDQVFWYLKG